MGDIAVAAVRVAASAATGVIPTMDAITEVREELLPLAMERIAALANAETRIDGRARLLRQCDAARQRI